MPQSTTVMAQRVADLIGAHTEIPIPDDCVPEMDSFLLLWLAKHHLRGTKPLDRWVPVDESGRRWTEVPGEA